MVVRARTLNCLKQVLLHVISSVVGRLAVHQVNSDGLLSLLRIDLLSFELVVRVERIILSLDGFAMLTGGVFVDRIDRG
jgi:hypothetical protein